MAEGPNPYRPPASSEASSNGAPDWEAAPDQRIRFEFTLDRRTVQQLLQSSQAGCVMVMAASLAGMLLLAAVSNRASGTGLPLKSTFLVFCFGLTAAAIAFAAWLGSIWRKALAQTPSLLEPTSGYLCRRGVYIERGGGASLCNWSTMRQILPTDRCLHIQAERYRMVTLLVPWDAFEDVAAARSAVSSVNSGGTVEPLEVGDDRLRKIPDEEPLFAPPTDAVVYSGSVTYGQFTATEPGRRMRQVLHRWLWGTSLAVLLGGSLMFVGIQFALFPGLPLVVLGMLLGFRVARLFRQVKPDAVAVTIRGWVSETDFFVHSAAGQAIQPWSLFSETLVTPQIICLRLPGSAEAWHFLPRTLFASDEDFRRASTWAAASDAKPSSVRYDPSSATERSIDRDPSTASESSDGGVP